MRDYFKIVLFFVSLFHSIIITTSINADLNYDLVGDGFHRTLSYKINLHELIQTDCTISLHITLPPEIYVNVDEIADLKRLGKAVACSVGEIDVELFAEKAGSQNVTICEKLQSTKTISLFLPIHQRYKFSEENGGYVVVDIPKPKLLLGCKNRLNDHRVSKIDLCSPCTDLARKWREIPYRTESDDKVWQVPVGNMSHLNVVSHVTLLVTSLGAVVVLRSLLRLRSRYKTVRKED